MPTTNIFTDVAAIGRDFLGLNRTQKQLRDYDWQLKTIWDLLKETHSLVVKQLEAIQAASTLTEAQALAKQLEGDPLTASFRARGLCDIFEGYGRSLRGVTATVLHGAPAAAPQPLAHDRQHAWHTLCDALEGREHQVALLYSTQLRDLADRAQGPQTPRSLSQLKSAARKARDVLTDQVADFEALAGRFRRASATRRP
jgi:hypothetical protein